MVRFDSAYKKATDSAKRWAACGDGAAIRKFRRVWKTDAQYQTKNLCHHVWRDKYVFRPRLTAPHKICLSFDCLKNTTFSLVSEKMSRFYFLLANAENECFENWQRAVPIRHTWENNFETKLWICLTLKTNCSILGRPITCRQCHLHCNRPRHQLLYLQRRVVCHKLS